MAQDTINISDIFFGSDQSKYAGIALFMTILILCLIILFSSSKIPIGERFIFVLFILIISVPSILMSLFELTCIVTGGNYTTRWWCWLLAWVISVIIIVYCILIIISMFISMSNFEMANDRLNYVDETNKINKEDADMYAKNMLKEHNNSNNVLESHKANEVNSRSPQLDMMQMQQMQQAQPMNHELPASSSVVQPPPYKEPKHNVNGNMISFPQNSSDLTGFEASDKYLSIDKASVPDINYTSEYKLMKAAENNGGSAASSVSNYDGFDSADKLSPY